jgi:hypothetical protein
MAKRRLDDWLTSHLEYTEHSESPISYHTWAAISCIASALQRRVYVDWETRIYPNQYIILIGPSANARKGYPLDLARTLINKINIFVAAENPTPEALIVDIQEQETTFKDGTTGKFPMQSPVYIVAEELSVLLGQQNIMFLSFLTNWYDSRGVWHRRTKHGQSQKILGVSCNILASTAPDWLPSILTQEAIGGGFTSRCIFVVEEKKRQTILDPADFRPPLALLEDLAHDLETMLYTSGKFEWDNDAKELYKEWYSEEDRKIDNFTVMGGDPALRNYAGRRTTHLRKLMMCMSMSRDNDLQLTKNDFDRAKLLLEITEKKMPAVYKGLGRSRYVQETEIILSYIRSKGSCLKSEMLMDLYRDIDEAALESIMNILTSMKIISNTIMPDKDDRRYTYKGDN